MVTQDEHVLNPVEEVVTDLVDQVCERTKESTADLDEVENGKVS